MIPTPEQDRRAECLISQHDALAVTPPAVKGGVATAIGIDGDAPTWRYVIEPDGSLFSTRKVKP